MASSALNLICKRDTVYTPSVHDVILKALRRWMLKRYRLNLIRSFLEYLKKKHGEWRSKKGMKRGCKRGRDNVGNELRRDLTCGVDVLIVTGDSWERAEGSSLVFYRWPVQLRKEARDGAEVFKFKEKPSY